ncbi:MarC family protein [Carboxylicivirga sp. A043]|uniref:MarC family protein n=1 Tax=Carboxylicivirga litoralis TaxID=2816963 RepID=UPI0021CB49F7|nr:MarC family protein [Carboxylicivirga sp. A043]MCU4156119.1 MarC family protein [Carboxylicivirga sp. A043]
MSDFIRSITLLLILLNPFLLIVYLIDIVKSKSMYVFIKILIRAGLISFVTFSCFAILGDSIFNSVFNARLASFQIFGGIIFLLTGIQFVFKGNSSIESLRGESKHVAGAIAMPIFIGPGTISYSVLIGEQLNNYLALAAIGCAVLLCISIIALLKIIHDRIQTKKEELIEQYIDIAGRVIAMLLGTVSIELIMTGADYWLDIL